MSRRIITIQEALGPQNKGAVIDPRLRSLTQEQLKDIYEWRKDILGHIDPRIGLQFTPDPEVPWLNPNRMKVNLGRYRQFTTDGWITISSPDDPERHRSEFCMPLELLKVKDIDFLYAPFILASMQNPLAALRNWKDCLSPVRGVACIIVEDQIKKLRKGLPFDLGSSVRDGAALKQLMHEAGFIDLCLVNLNKFDLCGTEDHYVGYFGFTS